MPTSSTHQQTRQPNTQPTPNQTLNQTLSNIQQSGLYKSERVLTSPQGASISVQNDAQAGLQASASVLNFCANNYLGLANHPALIEAAQEGLMRYGFGLSSVRFICGTQVIHKDLEAKISEFLGTDDTILYSSCFDANGGLFETLLTAEDAVISDALNHASIIDGIRLCKAQRYRYAHSDMNELETALQASQSARQRLIATDGVFSMDGDVAKLKEICELAERYNAMVMVDDSHATGFFGPTGRGTAEHCGVMGRVDIITSTLGKALGGASGGFTSGRQVVIDLLRQRSRPYLFSNTLAPVIVYTSLQVLKLLKDADGLADGLRETLKANTRYFRQQMTAQGFNLTPGHHPIVPIMLYDAQLAAAIAQELLAEGIYAIAFSYPVVPQGQARIRVQLSAAHTRAQIDQCVAAFTRVAKKHHVID